MQARHFADAITRMSQDLLGQTLERRQLEMLAPRYGIYFNSTMWAAGLEGFFVKGRLGSKRIYKTINGTVSVAAARLFLDRVSDYRSNQERKILHAIRILNAAGIEVRR